MDAKRLVEIASGAALAVADQVLDAFRDVGAVDTKRDFHDPVTEHDRRTEETIRRALASAAPESRVCGEELGGGGEAELVWFVDPIDGTNNFVSGIPLFCISIGAVWRGELAAGVVYDPVRRELFSATREGAFCNGARLTASGAQHEREAMLVTSYPTHRAWTFAPKDGRSDLQRFGEMVQRFRAVRRLGSATLALAYVAAGRVDVGFFEAIHPWDVAAGILLVRAAGGSYVPLPATPDHERAPWLAPGYLACVRGFDLDGSCMGSIARAGLD
ncbi:MAG TPA: inositol monophosphatase family protein [Chloroflexota bacterium]